MPIPNPVNYSVTKPNNVIKHGNFYYGINALDYGPTSKTGYYSGSTSSGYVSYYWNGTKLSYNKSINDSALVSWLSGKAALNLSNLNNALAWASTQSNISVTNRSYEDINLSGLIFSVDAGYIPSYPRGDFMYDIIENYQFRLQNGQTYDGTYGSIIFDGSGTIVTQDNDFSYNFSTNADFSWLIWLYPGFTSATPENSTNAGLIDYTTPNLLPFQSGYNRISLGYAGLNGFAYSTVDRDSGGSTEFFATASFSANTWNHLTFVHYGSSNMASFYFNSIELSVTYSVVQDAISTSSRPFTIGYSSQNGSLWLGRISIVQAYNRALTASEITAAYNAQKIRYGL